MNKCIFGLIASSVLVPVPVAMQAKAQAQDAGAARSDDQSLDEIVVTARKQGAERLLDVPSSITAVTAANLVNNNQLRIQDYYTQIPNFSVAPSPDVGNSQILQVRGITTGIGSSPTVGILLDDVPLGITGNTIPELDPSDLAQIEVLRGPHGVTYGSATMGGLLRYVSKDPSTDEVSGRVQAGISGVRNGSSVGYMMRGAVNLPLAETLAVRASGYSRKDPGYVDNTRLGIDGINEQDTHGGRVVVLWRPSSDFSAKLSALYQKTSTDGSGYVTMLPGLGDLQQDFIAGAGIFDQKIQAYSLTLSGKIGSFDVTSLSGYNKMNFTNALDFSYLYGPLSAGLFGAQYSGAIILPHSRASSFTQEVRISTPIGSALSWQLGGFYRRGRSASDQDYPGVDPTTGEYGGYIIRADTLQHNYEKAIFTDLTVHVTDQFDVEFGARQSWLKGTIDRQVLTGALYPAGSSSPYSENKSKALTYLLAPRYKFNENLMVYARLASGFRPGGGVTNPQPTTRCVVVNVPCSYGPDKTHNYEVGAKGSILDGKLTFDASLYYIDWSGVQILQTDALANPYTSNGGKAKSQGVELSLSARPADGWTISTWIAYNDAVLAEDFPAGSSAYGKKGDRLPNSSRFSGNVGIQRHFEISDDASGFLGGTLSYIGDMYGIFMPTAARQHFSKYARLDLSGGVNAGSWSFNVYMNNVTDKRVAIGGGLGTFPPYAFGFIQPRNYGLSIAKNF